MTRSPGSEQTDAAPTITPLRDRRETSRASPRRAGNRSRPRRSGEVAIPGVPPPSRFVSSEAGGHPAVGHVGIEAGGLPVRGAALAAVRLEAGCGPLPGPLGLEAGLAPGGGRERPEPLVGPALGHLGADATATDVWFGGDTPPPRLGLGETGFPPLGQLCCGNVEAVLDGLDRRFRVELDARAPMGRRGELPTHRGASGTAVGLCGHALYWGGGPAKRIKRRRRR